MGALLQLPNYVFALLPVQLFRRFHPEEAETEDQQLSAQQAFTTNCDFQRVRTVRCFRRLQKLTPARSLHILISSVDLTGRLPEGNSDILRDRHSITAHRHWPSCGALSIEAGASPA